MQAITFDGFFFTPGVEDGELELSFFDYNEENLKNAEKVENTAYGDKYHIAFFKPDGEGFVEFDETFEAIFADPVAYVENLNGTELFGCVLRKTTQSDKWFNNYLTKAKENVTIHNMQLKKGL
jgi:hypothetical protein